MATTRKEVRTRKSLGRSLWACSTCLEKHTKCDETRPQCLKCAKYSRICTYGNSDPSKEWQRNIVTFNTTGPSVTPTRKPSGKSKGESQPTSNGDARELAVINRRHATFTVPQAIPSFVGDGYSGRDIQALSHFVTVTAGDLIGSQRLWTQDGIQLALSNDFLMHAVLMTSASHLQRLNPETQHEYKLLSTKHLHHSLRSFRSALSSRTYVANNFEAVVATTFLFVMHACSSPIFDPEYPVIDALLQHSSGIFDIIRYHPCQALFSIFQPICTPKLLPATLPDSGPALNLIGMVKRHAMNHSMPDPNTRFYIAIIKSLAPILDVVIWRPPFGDAPPDALLLYFIHWLSFLPPEFVMLVNSYDTKALVIMAHYYAVVAFVLSNWKHGWWWLRGRPEYMIKNIAAFAGEGWRIWMRWPLSVLELCGGNDGSLACLKPVSKIHSSSASVTETTEMGILAAVEVHPNKIKVEG